MSSRRRACGCACSVTSSAHAGRRRAVDRVIARDAHNDRARLNLFISYGARAEIVRAARALAHEAAAGRLDPETIDEETLSARLYTADCPDPDLLIRTSGEQRISNFLLWQLAYAELYITTCSGPTSARRDLFEAIAEFQRRDRRYGRVTA